AISSVESRFLPTSSPSLPANAPSEQYEGRRPLRSEQTLSESASRTPMPAPSASPAASSTACGNVSSRRRSIRSSLASSSAPWTSKRQTSSTAPRTSSGAAEPIAYPISRALPDASSSSTSASHRQGAVEEERRAEHVRGVAGRAEGNGGCDVLGAGGPLGGGGLAVLGGRDAAHADALGHEVERRHRREQVDARLRGCVGGRSRTRPRRDVG